MGQAIEVSAAVFEEIAMFDTDRAITGQDGVAFSSAEEAGTGGIPGRLAERLFTEVPAIDHVFVASNQVVVRRPHGWDDHVVDSASRVIAEHFLFYPPAAGG